MKIVVLDGYTLNPGDLSWEGIEALGSLTVYDRTAHKDVAARIGDAELVIANKTSLTDETMVLCPNMKYIGVIATGYNSIDTEAAKRRGIVVTNVPTYGTMAVAQLAFALLLEICHHAGAHNESVMRGDWTRNPDYSYWNYPLIELADKTMGIVGFGRIGQAVGRIAQAFGMKVIACDAVINPLLEAEGFEYTELNDLLARADVVSLNCPLLPSTQGIINRDSIAGMKDGAILINTSRGPLVVEEDIVEALESGKLRYAATDVVSEEPMKPDNPLLKAKNIIITPHIAWAPLESRRRLMDVAVNNIKAFLDGKPENVVNP